MTSLHATFREHDEFTVESVEKYVDEMVQYCEKTPDKRMEIIFKDRTFRIALEKVKNNKFELQIITRSAFKEVAKKDVSWRRTISYINIKNPTRADSLTPKQEKAIEGLLEIYSLDFRVENEAHYLDGQPVRSLQKLKANLAVDEDVKKFLKKFFLLFPKDTKLWEDGPW